MGGRVNLASWTRALRWPLWSWRNLTITAVAVLVVMAALGRITAAPQTSVAATVPLATPGVSSPSTPTVPATDPPTTSALPSTSPSDSTPSVDAHSPVASAAAFAAAWVHTTLGQATWLAGMRPWSTASLLASLKGTDPRQVPASRVTGDAALLRTSGTSAVVSVPTDGGRIAVSMIRTAGVWKANGLAPDDAPPGATTPSLGPSQPATGN